MHRPHKAPISSRPRTTGLRGDIRGGPGGGDEERVRKEALRGRRRCFPQRATQNCLWRLRYEGEKTHTVQHRCTTSTQSIPPDSLPLSSSTANSARSKEQNETFEKKRAQNIWKKKEKKEEELYSPIHGPWRLSRITMTNQPYSPHEFDVPTTCLAAPEPPLGLAQEAVLVRPDAVGVRRAARKARRSSSRRRPPCSNSVHTYIHTTWGTCWTRTRLTATFVIVLPAKRLLNMLGGEDRRLARTNFQALALSSTA